MLASDKRKAVRVTLSRLTHADLSVWAGVGNRASEEKQRCSAMEEYCLHF